MRGRDDGMGTEDAGGPGAGSSRRRIVALALLAYLLFFAAQLWVYHGDVSRFVTAGDTFFDQRRLSYPIAVEHASDGYDGQFYYRLALNPATTRRTEHGITIDSPPVRAQRIGYPALAWLASGGVAALIPYALVGLNLVGLAGIAWLGARLATLLGAPPRQGLLFVFYPGFVLTLARDTTEIVGTFLALAALTLATRGRAVAAALVGVAAVLTRETTLLYLAGFGLVEAWNCVRRRQPSTALFAYLLPPLAYVGWQAVLIRLWGASAIGDVGAHDLAFPPLVDYAGWLGHYLAAAFSSPIRYRFLFSFVSVAAVGVFVFWVARVGVAARAGVAAVYLIPFALYALMTLSFTGAVWNEPWGYLRVLCDGYVVAVALILAARPDAMWRWLTRSVAVLWLGAAVFAL